MKIVAYYIKLYIVFIKNTLSREMDYRANFIGDLIDSFANFSVSIIFFNSIFLNVNDIEGWTKHESLLLLGTSQLIVSIIFMLFMNNLPRIQSYVVKGDLDYITLKPCDEQFYVSFRYFYFGGISNLILSIILIIYSLNVLSISIELTKLCGYLIFVICGVCICYAMWFTIMTCSILFLKVKGLHELFLSSIEFMQYPRSIYKSVFGYIFSFVIPFATIANTPVEYIISKATFLDCLFAIPISIMFLLLSRMFWKYSLRWYQSASS